MKNHGARARELDALGGKISNAKHKGDTFTARVTFTTTADANNAATKLRGLGWGASVDGFTVRCLVVVA